MPRNQQLQIRVSEEEKRLYLREAKINGVGISEWIRGIADLAVGAKALRPKRIKVQKANKKKPKVTSEGIVVPIPTRPKLDPIAFENKRSSVMEEFIKKGGSK